MLWLDEKYTKMVGSTLERFKIRKPTPLLAVCRCPICGDSQKNKFKTRGYFFTASTNIRYLCHNCGVSYSLEQFMEVVSPDLLSQYRFERFQDKEQTFGSGEQLAPAQTPARTVDPLVSLVKITDLSPGHPAREYVERRRIPLDQMHRLYYVKKFAKWVNEHLPDKFSQEVLDNDEPRLIIPLRDFDGTCFGVQGRSFDPKNAIRYITIIFDKSKIRAFGLNNWDADEKTYIFEGPLDSLFIPNSIANCGSSLIDIPGIDKDNTILVYDNEPRNKEIAAHIKKAIRDGYTVCLWPKDIVEKDVNEMILAGKTAEEIKMIIDTNSFVGMSAQLEFAAWRKD